MLPHRIPVDDISTKILPRNALTKYSTNSPASSYLWGSDWLLLTVGREGREAGMGEGKSTVNLLTPNASLSFKEIKSLFV